MIARKVPPPPGHPVVLIMAMITAGFGGLETHVLNLYKLLSDRGRRPLLLVLANSPLHRQVLQARLRCYAIRHYRLPGSYRLLSPLRTAVLLWICRRHAVQVIHCNNRFELRSALRVAKLLDVRVVLNYHVTTEFETKILEGVDAFVAPAPPIVEFVAEQNRVNALRLKQVRVLPPLFDADKFIAYQSMASPAAWFRETFGIETKRCPIVCTIGNMVQDLLHKNYPLLFEALAILIHEKGMAVQAVLAGDGPVRSLLEEIARNLNIRDYVHFLGATSEHTAGVLHHSDVFVLASSREAFGIVYLEAGLMRKPSIGARKTGAEHIIVDRQTGLLFKNGSSESLADAIAELVEHPSYAHQLGAQALVRIKTHFAPALVVEQYEDLYTTLTSAPQDERVAAPGERGDASLAKVRRNIDVSPAVETQDGTDLSARRM
jgi:glycosyltransferase involved in cell wall biosynthesis